MEENVLSMEPEIAVLSIILNNPEEVYNLGNLAGHMFSSRTHQNLFYLMKELGDKNLLPDLSMVINYASSVGKLDMCGGTTYIQYLLEQKYNRENFQQFARIIKNSYKVQTLVSLAKTVSLESIKIDTVDDNITEIQNNLDKLLDESGGEGTYKIDSLVRSSIDEIKERVKNPGIRGESTGIKKVDSITGGYDGGDLWYIGARPGQGKTSTVCYSSMMMGTEGKPSLIFSKEMTRQPIIERFLSMESKLPLFDIRMGLLKPPELEKLSESAKKLSTYPIYIDLNFTSAIEQIESTIRKYNSLYGVNVVFLDYIQLLSERTVEQTQELGRISRKLKLLSNSLDITTVVISQLNREVEHRDNKRPMMADLRQCGNLEEDADFIIGLYRDEYYNKDTKDKGKMEFIILKQRNGPTGTIMLGFDGTTTRVREE